jgi:hypothetical protein
MEVGIAGVRFATEGVYAEPGVAAPVVPLMLQKRVTEGVETCLARLRGVPSLVGAEVSCRLGSPDLRLRDLVLSDASLACDCAEVPPEGFA